MEAEFTAPIHPNELKPGDECGGMVVKSVQPDGDGTFVRWENKTWTNTLGNDMLIWVRRSPPKDPRVEAVIEVMSHWILSAPMSGLATLQRRAKDILEAVDAATADAAAKGDR